jgi:integrase
VWWYAFRLNGRRYRDSTATTNKHLARDIEAKERARILEGRHGIRRQRDIAFAAFAKTYLTDHAEVNKRSVDRDRESVKVLNRYFGDVLLHEITAHRIEQFKRDRGAGVCRSHRQKSAPRPVKPGTVNRELDTLRSILSKAVEWKVLVASPAVGVKRIRVENTRTRVLSLDEQRRLLQACKGVKLRAYVELLLITGARAGELLQLTWDDVADGHLTFLQTKNGRPRQVPIGRSIATVLQRLPRVFPWVFASTAADRAHPELQKGL